MRTVYVLFDSLNRSALGCYGGTSVPTPNFDAFAERAVTFDTHYVGSLPCMPARRDMQTGRLNFMHRSWGPLEPFDNSVPSLLTQAGVHTHLVTDHLHYFEDGGATYHCRYKTWDFVRGQEYDPWKAMVEPPIDRFKQMYSSQHYDFDRAAGRLQHAVNREYMRDERDFPTPRCFDKALDFLDTNHAVDNWFLQLECFDPHEPFHAPERFRQQFATGYNGPILDWPVYQKVAESPEEIRAIRANYAAVVAMCDDYFGRLLACFDRLDLWRDTALVLSTDHGFLLSEHDWWGKNRMPYYEEISHVPLLICHPELTSHAGERRHRLSQTYDLAPTLLELHGLDKPREMTGASLLPMAESATVSNRETGIFGMFGGPVGATDGRYTYYLYPHDLLAPGLHEYTLMPMHLNTLFSSAEIATAELAGPFDFTKDMPLMKIDALRDARRIPIHDDTGFEDTGTRLYDVQADPAQDKPFRDADIESRFAEAIALRLREHDTPVEFYARYGVGDGAVAV
ncbi:MAG: sulfatase [Gammaproteobacteria bacterium]